MNTFTSTTNPQTNGILKLDYQTNSPQIEALKRRRAKLTENITTPVRDELNSESKLGELE